MDREINGHRLDYLKDIREKQGTNICLPITLLEDDTDFSQSQASEGMKREIVHAARICKTGERFHSMGVSDIMRESAVLLHANSSLLLPIMTAFICPVSAMILSHVLVDGILVSRLSKRFEDVVRSGGLGESLFRNVLCLKLSETLVSYTFCLPVFITLGLLAKSATTYTVACTYAGKRTSIQKFLFVVPNLWKRIFVTYLWVCAVILGATSMGVLLLLVVASLLEALELSGNVVLLSEVIVGVAYSVIYAHIMVISSLANVVSVLEEYSGGAALLRSLFLIRRRTQAALLLFVVTALSMAVVESLFQYHVIGIPENSNNAHNATRWLEGSLLVFVYSFLYLFDAIMSSVFYFNCKSAYVGSSDENWMLEQISIGLDLMN